MKFYKINVTIFFLLLTLLATSSICLAKKTPSCSDDIAAKSVKAGTSPECAPVLLDNETSIDFLKKFFVKKIKSKWYIFLSEKDFAGEFNQSARWISLSMLISSVQSLYNDKADCFIVRIPKTEKEKEALLAGNYPKELIAAHGQFVSGEDSEKKDWQEYHHHLLYKMTVY